MDRRLYREAAGRFLQLPIVLGALLFLPAGTVRYWQGWLFIAVFFVCSLAITVYLAINDPALLQRRMRAGPAAEKERSQKIIMFIAMLSFVASAALPAFDHRFGWSHVPAPVVIASDALIVLGFLATYRVLRENSYSASTIQISPGQHVISTGPYAAVRHPMYSAGLVILLATPLALGSWWGLMTMPFNIVGIVWRLLDEEKFLRGNLAGYAQYMDKVRYRLLPFVW